MVATLTDVLLLMRCENYEFLSRRQPQGYLFLNELIGYVNLSDFDEAWAKYLSDISAPKFVRL